MMEQNSDRLYWIIGAVVVGSLLILIAYHFFPTLFKTKINDFFDNMVGLGKDTWSHGDNGKAGDATGTGTGK